MGDVKPEENETPQTPVEIQHDLEKTEPNEDQLALFGEMVELQKSQTEIIKIELENADKDSQRHFTLAEQELQLNEKWWGHQRTERTQILRYSMTGLVVFLIFLWWLGYNDKWDLLTAILSFGGSALLGGFGGWGIRGRYERRKQTKT